MTNIRYEHVGLKVRLLELLEVARIIQVEFCIIRTEIKALHVRCGEIGKLDTSKGGL